MKNRTVFGSRERLLSGLWILTGCFFLGVNGLGFMALLNDPLPEPSREVMMARSNFNRFKETHHRGEEMEDAKTWLASNLKFAGGVEKNPKRVSVKRVAEKKSNPGMNQADMPVLSGILSFTEPNGQKGYFAILDGRTLGEKEKVRGFIVSKISENGVFVGADDAQWFIDAPKVEFSISH